LNWGCWLGGSTSAALEGLSKNKKVSNKKYRVYDRFLWQEGMKLNFPDIPLKVGESFEPTFRENTNKWSDLLIVNNVDLTCVEYNAGEIEWMFIDAFKTTHVTKRCVVQFFPHLMVGSEVFHQDLGFPHAGLLALYESMYRLREYFRPMYDLASTTVVFKTIKKIPLSVCRQSVTFDTFTKDNTAKAFGYVRSMFNNMIFDFKKIWG
jgi:hypothetical protein